MTITGKVFSTLGSPVSLVPLALKDCANGAGMTAASSVTSKDEGADRFIDEFGTEAIWLGGIPLFKKISDNTLFKAAKLDPKYDIRNFKNQDIFQKTIEWAPSEKIKNDIKKIGENKKTFKNLNIAKFLLSTVLTLGTYNLMTDLKQKYTHGKIKKKLIKQQEEQSISLMNNKGETSDKIKDLNFQNLSALRNKKTDKNGEQSNNPNFTGIADFMLNPVKNMYVLDAGITTERLIKSRSPQELTGYTLKEGGFLFFMYYLGQKVQSHFEKTADKKHNKSIALDSKVIEDNNFKRMFSDKSIERNLKDFSKIKTDTELYDFINKNPDNAVISAAKQSDIISTYKKPKKPYQIFKKAEDTGKIDTRKYINLDKVREVHSNISRLYNQYKTSNQSSDEFFKDVRKLKRGSVMKNIGSTVFALGFVLPSIMLADRLLRSGNKEFAVEKKIKEQLEREKM